MRNYQPFYFYLPLMIASMTGSEYKACMMEIPVYLLILDKEFSLSNLLLSVHFLVVNI